MNKLEQFPSAGEQRFEPSGMMKKELAAAKEALKKTLKSLSPEAIAASSDSTVYDFINMAQGDVDIYARTLLQEKMPGADANPNAAAQEVIEKLSAMREHLAQQKRRAA